MNNPYAYCANCGRRYDECTCGQKDTDSVSSGVMGLSDTSAYDDRSMHAECISCGCTLLPKDVDAGICDTCCGL